MPNFIIWIIQKMKFPVQVLVHGLLPKYLYVSVQSVYVWWGLGEKRLLFFSDKSIFANRYRNLGASPSELRESWMKALLLHHVEGGGCCLYNYYDTLITGKEEAVWAVLINSARIN